jgi:hypothetical protein
MEKIQKLGNPDSLIRWVVKIDVLDPHILICLIQEQDNTFISLVLDYRSGGLGSIPGTTRKKSSGSGTGSAQPREYN